ncbi:hypothetical protein BRAS3843_1730029 [Bradyrhizobium sp. STM 3843]|uniref:hypothetical protein n=1 Tax=Bradyrhizobium sp. STM 3843 TaxID=551947 RepID=UPI000240712E|nr:hypothetical protein [Bradyrhizobium sp. STM 3843]CCE06460.1 hypothetical protein BRAS3843_1730029 [Bradyrhizobium sp. STM 3843]
MPQPGLSDAKAARMLEGFRAGHTMRPYNVKQAVFRDYCDAHPEYAKVAQPLLQANYKAANARKGERHRSMTHCRHGHSLADAWVTYQNGYSKRDCRTCWLLRSRRGGVMKPETFRKVEQALINGAPIGQITHGHPMGGRPKDLSLKLVDAMTFARKRREDPVFDALVREKIALSRARGRQFALVHRRTRIIRAQNDTFSVLRAVVPMSLPRDVRDDVIGALSVAMLEQHWNEEQVRQNVRAFINAHYRQFTKFGPISLDLPLFDGSSATLKDTIVRGLWD